MSPRSLTWRASFGWLAAILLTVAPLAAGEIEDLYKKWVRPRNVDTAPQQARFERLEKPIHGVSEIGLERTACFGGCPVYSVVLKSDGSVRYEGLDHVAHQGERLGEIPVSEFNQLAEFLIDSGYLGLATEFPSGITDLPGAFTTAVVDGKRKVVENTGGLGPVKLWALEQSIDAVVSHAQWSDEDSEKTTPDRRP
jgi:hypothetical protein